MQDKEAVKIKDEDKTADVNARKKRRSKHVITGRNHVCECGKAYLSFPALTSHKKSKHSIDPVQSSSHKQSRGRPKRDVNIYLFNKVARLF